MENLTIEQLNKINEHTTKLERLVSAFVSNVSEHMEFKEGVTFNNKNSMAFFKSSIETELKKLKNEHLSK